MSISTRQNLRKQFISLRNGLNEGEQKEAAASLVTMAKQHKLFTNVQNLALYISHKGEINTRPLIEYLWKRNINVYVPVLHPFCKGHLLFLQYHHNSSMKTNHYGMIEPCLDVTKCIPVCNLDLVFTPLVAFDAKGNRLGMGGGYYDRTLANIDKTRCKVIGLAHDCQFIDKLPIESWDVPLPNILTNKRYYAF